MVSFLLLLWRCSFTVNGGRVSVNKQHIAGFPLTCRLIFLLLSSRFLPPPIGGSLMTLGVVVVRQFKLIDSPLSI